jgi:hypothetical protein
LIAASRRVAMATAAGGRPRNHPDRAIARGLPPAAVAIATRRLAAINAAYDRIAV